MESPDRYQRDTAEQEVVEGSSLMRWTEERVVKWGESRRRGREGNETAWASAWALTQPTADKEPIEARSSSDAPSTDHP